jgi:uncharacterized delta-60 repeat protein
MRPTPLRRFARAAGSPAIAAISLVLFLSFHTVGDAYASPCNGECDFARAVVIDSEGRIVVAGGCEGPGPGEVEHRPPGIDLAVWRLNEDGRPDPMFGEGGAAFGLSQDEASALIIAPDGTLYAPFAGSGWRAISRFRPDGEPMEPLLVGAANPVGSRESWAVRYWPLVAIDSIGGFVFTDAIGWMTGTSERLVLRRVDPDGEADTTFGIAASGTGPHPAPSDVSPYGTGIVVDDTGRFLVAGNTRAGVTLWRFGVDGTPDTGFGNGGVVTRNDTECDRDDTAGDVAIDDDGRVLVTGATYIPTAVEDRTLIIGAVTLWRFTLDGQPDGSFGEDGHAVWRWPEPRTTNGVAIEIDTESRIVVLGFVDGRGPGV